MKKELPSGIGTIFSLGPENSGFNGATPAIKKREYREGISTCGVPPAGSDVHHTHLPVPRWPSVPHFPANHPPRSTHETQDQLLLLWQFTFYKCPI